MALRQRAAVPVEEARRARTFVRFDSLFMAPRFGFCDAGDYYHQVAVGPHLKRLRTPTLVVTAARDPMVPAASLVPCLEDPADSLEIRCVAHAGHFGSPGHLDLGYPGGRGVVSQVIGWPGGLL